MKSADGKFQKGEHRNPAGEFKPGQHWRPRRPYWDAAWLRVEYAEKGRSAADIAAEFGVTENAILFWLKKHAIPTRPTSEVRAKKYWGQTGEANWMYGRRGTEVPNWKGGCTPERQAFYSSPEWATACLQVWRRDDGKCQRCGVSHAERLLHIHHIVSFAVRETRADPANLVLLCVKCHRFVHSKRNSAGEFLREGGAQ